MVNPTRPGPLALAARLAGLTLVAVVGAGSVQADPALRQSARVAELAFGLICPPPDGARRPAPDTMSGWVHVPSEPIERRAEGRRVPAVLGIGFGVWYLLSDTEALGVRYTVTHPPMPPEGVTTQSWDVTITPGNASSVFFQFDHVDEVQPGDWTISARAEGAEVFAVGFTVVPARDLPALAQLCAQDGLLSFSRSIRAAAG